MPDFGELFSKAKKYATGHPGQVTKGIEKLEDLVDKETGGQYHDQVENAGHAAANYLGTDDPDRPGESGHHNQSGQHDQSGHEQSGQQEQSGRHDQSGQQQG